MVLENREYKDSVFADLFYTDMSGPTNFLSLMNAILDTDFQDESLLEKVRLEDVLFKNFRNDVAYLFKGYEPILFFVEHQSTINYNMPLRFRMYDGRTYERITASEDLYKEKLIKLPAPMYIVLYNGTKSFPAESVMKASDAFPQYPDHYKRINCEMGPVVLVININTNADHSILQKCEVLRQYSAFIDIVRKCKKEQKGLADAVKIAIRKNILKDYLIRKGSEVVNMLTAEYSYETDIRVKQEEARQEGFADGAAKTTVELYRHFGRSKEEAVVALQNNCGFTLKEAEIFVNANW